MTCCSRWQELGFFPFFPFFLPLFTIFPIPPLEKLGIVVGAGGIVDGTPEDVQHASVDMLPTQGTEVAIHVLRVFAAKVLDFPVSEVGEFLSQTLAHARDRMKLA